MKRIIVAVSIVLVAAVVSFTALSLYSNKKDNDARLQEAEQRESIASVLDSLILPKTEPTEPTEPVVEPSVDTEPTATKTYTELPEGKPLRDPPRDEDESDLAHKDEVDDEPTLEEQVAFVKQFVDQDALASNTVNLDKLTLEQELHFYSRVSLLDNLDKVTPKHTITEGDRVALKYSDIEGLTGDDPFLVLVKTSDQWRIDALASVTQ